MKDTQHMVFRMKLAYSAARPEDWKTKRRTIPEDSP